MKYISILAVLLVAMLLVGCGAKEIQKDVENENSQETAPEQNIAQEQPVTTQQVDEQFNDIMLDESDDVELGELI